MTMLTEVFGFENSPVQNLYQKNKKHSKIKLGTKVHIPCTVFEFFHFFGTRKSFHFPYFKIKILNGNRE